ncbi:hypothetical protein RFI_12702 [Reticulomyxa filosa]|uniref:Uncharacterized protein n=1 Tax=Reticulomyxa filosa TaxID=46433 RepID=X6NFE6_RETFI|nr:hypothetical protein RFI_12702 [Reticulomyxa filosa]|eukprot:ETO24454.1 hypothetical protein RFI_12702 [Reticulomyxa filosa]
MRSRNFRKNRIFVSLQKENEREKEKDRSKGVEWFNDAKNYLTGLTMSELDTVEKRKLKFACAKYYNDQVLNGRAQRKELLKEHGEKPMGKVKYELKFFVDHFSALMRFCKDYSSSDKKTIFQQFINGIYAESILKQQTNRSQCYLLNDLYTYIHISITKTQKFTKAKNIFIDIKKSKFKKHVCYNLSISNSTNKCISYLFNKLGKLF